MSKTTLWYVRQQGFDIIVDEIKPSQPSTKIRTITPNAAARKFIKEILPGKVAFDEVEDSPYEFDKKGGRKIQKAVKKKVSKIDFNIVVNRNAAKQKAEQQKNQKQRNRQKGRR